MFYEAIRRMYITESDIIVSDSKPYLQLTHMKTPKIRVITFYESFMKFWFYER